MAISLSYFPILSLLILASSTVSIAADVVYDFNITWVSANPDGAFVRPTIGINGQWPLPVIRATVGDNLIVTIDNQLGNQSTSLHFHGLYMNGTTHMDGPVQVSQCAVTPGTQFTYNFTIAQPGTYWYHSHSKGQYPDGLRAALIIEDPASPYKDKYDEEVVVTVSDWYHGQMQDILPTFINKANPTGAEPIPDAVLMNDTQNMTIAMTPGKTYLFRMINIGAFAGQYIWFENHTMSIVEVDGIYTEQADADMIYLGAAQRCSFLLTAKNETTSNYAFVSSMDTSLFDTTPDGLQTNATGWLVYDSKLDNPDASSIDGDFDEFDDFTLVPYDQQPLLENPDRSIELVVVMDNLDDGANYAFFNNITYVAPRVPTLYTVMSSGASASNAAIYGEYTNPFVLEKGQVVEIVVNNNDGGKHPFHLHGHNFQTVVRSDEDAGYYDPTNTPTPPTSPMRRDTIVVMPNGHLVLRFRSDNPGVWLFHCHIEWHVDGGLIATMVEAPLDLQQSLTIPEAHYDSCKAAGTPYTGNAAANTINLLDLSGQNQPRGPIPDGFTPRGIVALTFSCITALLGLATIWWYGMSEIKFKDEEEKELEKKTAQSAFVEPATAEVRE